MTELGTPVQGVTLYSFTRAFHARQYTFEDLVREVAARGLGPGLELVGFQSIRGFPHVDPALADRFGALIADTGLVPTCLSANADAGLRRDRMLSDDELVEYMRPQIAVAARLGFPVVRVQISLTPDDMERLLPVAEQHQVKLGLEIHSHQHPRHPRIQALLERYEKLGSPLLGFVPDWGASLRAVPSTLLRKYQVMGYDEELIDGLQRLWHEHHAEGPPMTEEQHGRWFGDVMQLAHRHGAGDRAIEMAVNITGLFGHAPAADWADVLPWAVHTHGKFYEIDDGDDPSVPVREIVELWARSGYSAAISSEWEGFHWNDWDDPFSVVAAEQRLVRRSAEAIGSRVVTDSAEARNLLTATRERNPHGHR
jgi:hypothetical protein